MKKEELDKYLGRAVEVTLYDNSRAKGTLEISYRKGYYRIVEERKQLRKSHVKKIRFVDDEIGFDVMCPNCLYDDNVWVVKGMFENTFSNELERFIKNQFNGFKETRITCRFCKKTFSFLEGVAVSKLVARAFEIKEAKQIE